MFGRPVAIGIALLLSLPALNWSVPSQLDSDTILQSLMSTQNLTLFYWGQDRFLNLVPFLLSPIRDPQTNFLATLILNGFAFFLLLEFMADVTAKVVFPAHRGPARLLMLAALVFSCILVLGRPGLYNFAYAAQPYGLSCLLTLTAWRLILRADRAGIVVWILAGVALFVAAGLNPSVLLISLGLFVVILPARRGPAPLVIMTIAGLSFVLWSLISRSEAAQTATYYTDFDFRNAFAALDSTLRRYQRETGQLWMAAGALLAACGLGFIPGFALPQGLPRLFGRVLAAFGLIWWVVFASNAWVKVNDGMFRYFFPSLMIVVLFVALRFVQLAGLGAGRFWKTAPLPALAIVLMTLFSRPVPIGHYDIFSKTSGARQYAAARQVRLVAGSYWLAWPTVLALNAHAYRQEGTAAPVVYGVAVRGSVNRAAIDESVLADYRAGLKSRALCVGESVEECRQQLMGGSGFFWDFLEQGDCHSRCYLLEATAIQSRTEAAMDARVASGISLSLDAKVDPGLVYVLVSIVNGSGETLNSLSPKGDLKLSWRVIPEDAGSSASPGWDNRQPLYFSLPPGQTRIEPLAFAPPESPGRYRIEVSLVQEGVTWLHDIGMQIASAVVWIPGR